MKVLIPAAGFGKRTSFCPIKELMLHEGKPLIEYSFQHLLPPVGISEVLLITRPQKRDLIHGWFHSFKNRYHFETKTRLLDFEPKDGQEWPTTLLATEDLWDESNLVLLPDTKLALNEKKGLAETFGEVLESFKTAWAVCGKNPSEARTFGVVTSSGDLALEVTEKPQISPATAHVWGCFGFQKKCGRDLLLDLERSTSDHKPFFLPEPSRTLWLREFEDLSRRV